MWLAKALLYNYLTNFVHLLGVYWWCMVVRAWGLIVDRWRRNKVLKFVRALIMIVCCPPLFYQLSMSVPGLINISIQPLRRLKMTQTDRISESWYMSQSVPMGFRRVSLIHLTPGLKSGRCGENNLRLTYSYVLLNTLKWTVSGQVRSEYYTLTAVNIFHNITLP